MDTKNQNQNEEKWYDKTWLAVLLVILFFPVGFYALFKSKKRSPLIKGIVTVLFLVLFIIAIRQPSKKETSLATTSKSSYEKLAEVAVSQLTADKKAEREKILGELKQMSVYITLVDSQKVSQDYILVLEGIGNVMASSNPEDFSVDEKIGKQLETDKNKLDFVVKLGTLMNKGGLPSEIEDVFNRYIKHYGLANAKGTTIVNANSNEQETITEDFSLAQAMAIYQPKDDKVLDAYFEAVQNGLLSWNTNLPQDSFYPYLNDPDAFNEHLRKYHKESPYFLDYDVRTTPVKLNLAYQENEVAADNIYKNKKVLLEGTVIDIGKDVLNDAYIILNTGSPVNRVQCFSFDEKTLGQLTKGSQVRVVGKCSGKILLNVVLKNCKVFVK